jgi:hypothetical protein
VRFTGFIDIPTPGTYRFSANSDDGFRLLIDGQMIMECNLAIFYENTSGDATFTAAGLYPLEVVYYDLQPCCNGIRMGALGPAGSGLPSLSENPGFDFNADLGPNGFAGRDTPGPGVSIIPANLFFTAPPAACFPLTAPATSPWGRIGIGVLLLAAALATLRPARKSRSTEP